MTKRLVPCLMATMVTLMACGGAECTRDGDCGGSRLCKQGRCLVGSSGGGAGLDVGTGGFGSGNAGGVGGGSAGRVVTTGGGSSGTAGGSAGGTASGGGSVAASCPEEVSVLTPGTAVSLSTTNSGGNPRSDFCFVVPPGAANIELVLSGGTCAPHRCIGNDVELYLKRGAPPDPFSPDASTKQWAFTPGGMGLKGTTAMAGPWFLSQIAGANTLGFRNVSLALRFQ